MRGKAGLFSRNVPFSPAIVPGLSGWWDASDSSTLFDATSGGASVAADGNVARWEDKSGNGRNWTQATSSARPIRKTSVKNSKDVVRFDGSSDVMASDGWQYDDILSANGFTVFAVAVATSVTTNSSGFFNVLNQTIIGDSGSYQYLFFFRSSGVVGVFANDTDQRAATVSYSAGDWKAFTSRWSSDSEELSVRLNGGTAGTASLAYLAAQDQSLSLGSGGSSSATFNGDLAELITYNVALSAGDREAVESYLMDKWAIT